MMNCNGTLALCFVVLVGCVPGSNEPPRSGPRPSAPTAGREGSAAVGAPETSAAMASAFSARVSPAPPTPVPTAAPPPVAPEAGEKLPEGFVRGPAEPGQRVTCGALEIEAAAGPDPSVPFVRIFDERRTKIYEAHGRRMKVDEGAFAAQWLNVGWCGDLTGDGIAEVFLAESTMGAHCCHTYYLVSLTRPAKTLLMWEKGDGGFDMMPTKVKPGKAWQVVSYHMVVPPFDAEQGDPVIAGYAGMPFYPIVFDLVGNDYRARTLAFPGWLEEERRKTREQCAQERNCHDNVFFDWGLSLMIGDWAKQRSAITDDDLLKSLDKHAPEMRRRLGVQLGR